MFIGHYATAFAAKAIKPRLPLWQLFIAAQLVDFSWAALVLAGVEKVRLQHGFMEASMLDLYHMPFTHSLPGAVVWSVLAGLVIALLWKGEHKVRAGLIFGGVVFSHWALDLIVHAPDLTLYPGGPKVGLGLWNSLFWSQLVEVGLLGLGFALYIANTSARAVSGRWAPYALFVFMLAVQGFSHLPVEEAPGVTFFAVQALFGYTLLAVLAWSADRLRA